MNIHNKRSFSLLFVIDVSGQPYEKTTIGLGSFIIDRQNKLLKEFYKKFPDFKKSRNKGCVLKETELQNILKFLNKEKIHMTTTTIKGDYWRALKKKYSNKARFKEKIMACLYFMILKKKSKQHFPHQVIIDKDSFMDLYKLIDYINLLANANKYDFSVSISRAKDNDLIRIVDYIAASHKNNKKFLEKLKYHTQLDSKIPELFLKKLFEKE